MESVRVRAKRKLDTHGDESKAASSAKTRKSRAKATKPVDVNKTASSPEKSKKSTRARKLPKSQDTQVTKLDPEAKPEKSNGQKTGRKVKKSAALPVKIEPADTKPNANGSSLSQESNLVAVAVKDEKTSSQKFIGAHVSIQGGLENAVHNAVAIGAKAFALFLRNQRQWACKPLQDETAEKFMEACKGNGFSPDHIVPHGSYLINLGAPNAETLRKSREAFLDEVQRCEKLGLTLYNFHPGSTCGLIPVDDCLQTIAESINLAHQQTKFVITLIENMSCQGNTVGGKFEELGRIIDSVDDKSRVGICLDTCHAFAAGYDLSCAEGFDKLMDDFESIIGFEYLRAVHLNDSKGKVGCHLDRHENIGKGYIGRAGFLRLMNEPRLDNIPMVLETPLGIDDETEIKYLYNLCG